MAVPIQSQIFNPITGVFGTGQMQIFGPGMSGFWTVPIGIGKCRVRMFGGGGTAGGGGGFSLKAIYDLTGVTSVPVIVGGAGGTSSFGSYCSATGGLPSSSTPGTGVGGDINTFGGATAGGGVGSLFGNGSGASPNIGVSGSNAYASGLFGSGSYVPAASFSTTANSGMVSPFSIDLLGTGAGSASSSSAYGQGVNGGGGYTGSFPGGGGQTNLGGPGMVIVEW